MRPISFVSIPKTASNSMSITLFNSKLDVELCAHAHILSIAEKRGFDFFNNSLRVACVRDPVTIFISGILRS